MKLGPLREAQSIPTSGVRLVGPLLILATVLAFSAALSSGFVTLDDDVYVVHNGQVQEGVSLSTLRYAFSGFRVWNWHPLTMLSHALDCTLYGLNPVGHHLTSVLFHAINACLLYEFLRRTTKAPARAAMVAALFALHPLRVESVAWISERKDVLCGLFFFLTLLAWARYAAAPRASRWILAAVLLSFGLMAKAMLVTTPFVLLLLEFWPLRRPFGARSVLDKLPLLLLCAIVSALTVLAQGAAVAPLAAVSFPVRVGNAAQSYFRYAWKTLWPVDLSIFYPLPARPNLGLGIAAGAALVVVLAVALALRRRLPAIVVGLCWFLGMLVPTIGLVQVGSQSMADRYSYLPQIGLLIAVVYSLPAPPPSLVAPVVAAAGCVLAILFTLTVRQCRVWISSETLFQHADGVAGDNFLVQGALANVAVDQGNMAEGETRYRRAIRMNRTDEISMANLGALLVREGRALEALQWLKKAERIEPDDPFVEGRLAAALVQLGRIDEGLAYYRQLLSAPHSAEAEGDYAVALGMHGHSSEALSILERAVAAEPDNARLHYNLGTMLAQQGRFTRAVAELQQALRLNPSIPDVAQSVRNALEDAQRHP